MEINLENFRGGSREGPPPPLFLDQTEAQREKKKFWDRPLPYLRVWMTADPAPPPLSEGLDLLLNLYVDMGTFKG